MAFFIRRLKIVPLVLLFIISSMGHPVFGQMERLIFFTDTTEINGLLRDARRLFMAGKVDSAAFIYRNTLNQSKQFLYQYGIVKSMIGIGNTQANIGRYEESIRTYQSAIAFCNTRDTRRLLTTIYNNLGNIYTFRGDFEQSMHDYERAIELAKQYRAELPLSTLYNNISIALNHLQQPHKALYYLEKGEELAIANREYYSLADIYNNKGFAYATLNLPEQSMSSFRSAIQTARAHGYMNTLYSAYVNMGVISINANHFGAAIAALEKAGTIEGSINPYYQNQRIFTLGAAYLKLKKYKLAEAYLKQSVALCEKLDILSESLKAHQLLAEVYAETNRFREAFDHRSIEKRLSDSLNKKEMLDAVSRMDIKYRTALKDQELVKRQLTINRQRGDIGLRNMWIAGVSICLVLLSAFFFLRWKNYRHKQRLKNEQLLNLEKQQELNVMKAIMSGEEQERIRLAREIHDGIMVRFSVIKMNLSALAGNGQSHFDTERLKPVLGQLDDATDDLRRTAHNLMPDMLLEEGLPQAVYYFCKNLKKNVPFRVMFQPLGDIPRLPVQFELSIYRIIQELVQNIIKHAEATEVIVQLSFEHQLLSVTVEDNGKGIPEGYSQDGMGIKSISARVLSMNGRMGIDGKENVGTSVHLEFDISDPTL
jgi:signal transduction histidine kinase